MRGDTAWGHLKFEGGTHRVQRVPVTESQGRIHTSSATVLVLPEAEEVEVEIDERDLEIDVYRSSGAGGQSVNTTDSAVRITHKPTGIVVTMQDERSQLQNRARAMTVLRARLLQLAQDEHDAAMSVERRSQVGGGGRGEKIRTYNYKENRVTDHRIGFTIYRLQDVLAGDLDDVVDALDRRRAGPSARRPADGERWPARSPDELTAPSRGGSCGPRPSRSVGGRGRSRAGCARRPAAPTATSSSSPRRPATRADGAPPRRDGRPACAPASRCSTCSAAGGSATST